VISYSVYVSSDLLGIGIVFYKALLYTCMYCIVSLPAVCVVFVYNWFKRESCQLCCNLKAMVCLTNWAIAALNVYTALNIKQCMNNLHTCILDISHS